jgi:hypothetical protein
MQTMADFFNRIGRWLPVAQGSYTTESRRSLKIRWL